MATVTNITADNICTEAYKLSGVSSPTSAQLTRAGDYHLQFLLNDIMNSAFRDGNTRLKTLQETLLDASVEGQRTLALAETMDEELLVEVLDGSRRATAQTGGASSITLVSTDTSTEANAEGRWILLTGGTGADQIRQITALNTSTLVATVDSAWDTTPDNTTTYLIVDSIHPLEEVHISEIESTAAQGKGRPSAFAKYNRDIIFDRAFDRSTYGIRVRYYMNIHEVDRTEGSTSRYTRILQNWQAPLLSGLTWKIMEDIDDNRQMTKMQEYEAKKAALLAKESPYGGEFTGFSL
jgi:hypothetical protein